jgi:uncharacterized protein YkwD
MQPRPIPLAVAMIALILAGAASPAVSAAPSIDDMERSVVDRVNAIRTERGLPPLQVDATLAAVARDHSCRMAEVEDLRHRSPTTGTVDDRVRRAGRRFRAVGENLAMNVNVVDPVATAVRGWMDSEGHRANILRDRYVETGVGICRAEPGYYFTQIFLRPPDA